MKRILFICIGLILLLYGSVASAEELNKNTLQGRTTVRLTVGQYYQVTIPAEMNLTYAAESTDLPLAVTTCHLLEGKELSISVDKSSGELKSGTDVLPYALQLDDKPFTAATFTDAGTVTPQIVIKRADWLNAPTGQYSDVLTFSVSVVDAEAKEGE